MKRLLHTTIGWCVIVAAAAAISLPATALAGAAPAQSAVDNASATWAAKAKLLDAYGHPLFAQLPAVAAIDAASATWAAKAKLLDAYGHPVVAQRPPVAAIDAASATWAAKAKLLDAYGRPLSVGTIRPTSASTGFDWGDFGIGLGAMLGLVLFTGGLALAAYYSRRSQARTHAAV